MFLPVRKLGSQGLECRAQALGCMGMSAFYVGWDSEEAQAESMRVLDKAGEFGQFMLDTSNVYGPRTNEQLIGRVIKGKREKYVIATKCGFDIDHPNSPVDSSPEMVKNSCRDSLSQLGIDCIDLYYLHRYDRTTPIEETMGAFNELIKEGKIKYVGVSEMSVPILRRAHAVCPITAYQMEWSLFSRDVEEELVPTCRELGIGIVPYSPLGRGFLAGAFKTIDDLPASDSRRRGPRFNEYFNDNLKLVEVVKEVATAKGCTPGQVALSWLHSQGDDVFPIPGTKKLSRFEENMGGFNVVLSDEDKAKVNEIADKVKGNRYSAALTAYNYNA